MPNNPSEWMWWVFSAVLVGIAINLISPRVGRFLEKRFESYRLTQATNTQVKMEFVTKTVEMIEADSRVLSTVIYQSLDYRLRGVFAFGMALGVLALTLSVSGEGVIRYTLMGFMILIAVFAFTFGDDHIRKSRLYDAVVATYEKRIGIPKLPESL